jgi:hypothetical protein
MSASNTHLPVLDQAGTLLFFADDETCRELLRAGQCRLIRRGGRDRALVATSATTRAELQRAGGGTGFNHTRYSHRHETTTNPPRVWCLTPQRDPAVFGHVIATIMADPC